ncbi:MAG: mechanosensitive ion channel family protein [Anaerolineae bacterium]
MEETGTSAMTTLVGLAEEALAKVPEILSGIIIFLIFVALSWVVRRIVRRIFERRALTPDVEELIEQSAAISLIVVGLVTGLGTMGVNIGGLVASLGLVGFAVGFALRDAISNTLAGILLLVYHPFERGDHIQVSGTEGTVLEIDLRYTILDAETERVLVPNAQLFTNVVRVKKRGQRS